ncbi:MAG: hypothetical protein K2H35_07320 [Muribaculaceae bacterium]|nr:hypothetical protein [Muribaculaceae bacterium]
MKFREKFLSLILILIAAATLTPSASAITDREMEQARAVAAKYYLRWANNGSDYLDNLDPKSLADLEGKLKQKEKENIKAFKSVSVPSDYAKWDKEKAVAYWSETFFKSSGLSDQGRGAKSQVRKRLSSMSFSAPSESAPKAETPAPAPAEEAAPELPSAAPTAEEAAPAAEVPSAEEIVAQTEAIDSALSEEIAAPEETTKKSGGSNWLYIVALVVLVGIVVWLVIFASRTMQNSAKAARDIPDEDDTAARPSVPVVSESAVKPVKLRQPVVVVDEEPEESESILRDRYARRISAKDTEIHDLQRQIRDLRDENLRLADENSKLNSDLSMARRELEALKQRNNVAAASVSSSATHTAHAASEPQVREHEVAATRSRSGNPSSRDIYLGRVNAKGIFVRADRKPIEDKSVFVLSTTDSYTGTFRVLQSEATINMALDNPEYYLSGGCVAEDILATEDAESIRTLSSGTAIFEDGCWRVLRKAKIAYE